MSGTPAVVSRLTVTHLGQELRQLRRARGWTLRDLHPRLTAAGFPVREVRISRYERGEIPLTVGRLAVWCRVLEIRPAELWATVDAQVLGPVKPPELEVDVHALTTLAGEEWEPLRGWAQHHAHNGATTVRVRLTALPPLAVLCRVNVDRLRDLLVDHSTGGAR